jgi:hypothetical protein
MQTRLYLEPAARTHGETHVCRAYCSIQKAFRSCALVALNSIPGSASEPEWMPREEVEDHAASLVLVFDEVAMPPALHDVQLGVADVLG